MRLNQSQSQIQKLLMRQNQSRSQIQKLLMNRIKNKKWKSLMETSVDLLTEPIMEVLLSSLVMRVPLSLKPHDVYDPLQIFF